MKRDASLCLESALFLKELTRTMDPKIGEGRRVAVPEYLGRRHADPPEAPWFIGRLNVSSLHGECFAITRNKGVTVPEFFQP